MLGGGAFQMTYLHTNSLSKFTEEKKKRKERREVKTNKYGGEYGFARARVWKGFVCPPQVLKGVSIQAGWRISLPEWCTACVYMHYSNEAPTLLHSFAFLSVRKKTPQSPICNDKQAGSATEEAEGSKGSFSQDRAVADGTVCQKYFA